METRIGVVVSTFGSPGFVHLQIASAARFAPGVTLLIHDDSSGDSKLNSIARRSSATLVSTAVRLGHTRGDVAAYSAGLKWAQASGLDYLVKISRRFIPIQPWLTEFRSLAEARPATIGARDTAFGWELRTEFIGLRVADWVGHLPTLASYGGGHVEEFMASVSRSAGDVAQFSFLGPTRYNDNGNFLWYNFAGPVRYSELARAWALPYGPEDFNTAANLFTE